MLLRRWKKIGLLITDGNGTAMLEKQRLEIKQTNIYLPSNPANILLSIYPRRNRLQFTQNPVLHHGNTQVFLKRWMVKWWYMHITGYSVAINKWTETWVNPQRLKISSPKGYTMLNFIKCFFSPGSHSHVIFLLLQLINMIDYIELFSNIRSTLHPWNKAQLITVNNSFYVWWILLTHFVKNFCIYIHDGYWSTVSFFFSCVWFKK